MNKALTVIIVVLCILMVFVTCSPIGRGIWNSWFSVIQKADNYTNYNTRKTVEDSSRSMITSYTSDKIIYEQYRNSEIAEERSWANQAKMRANKTAVTYNEYILKNSYVWMGLIPQDIKENLPYIE